MDFAGVGEGMKKKLASKRGIASHAVGIYIPSREGGGGGGEHV